MYFQKMLTLNSQISLKESYHSLPQILCSLFFFDYMFFIPRQVDRSPRLNKIYRIPSRIYIFRAGTYSRSTGVLLVNIFIELVLIADIL